MAEEMKIKELTKKRASVKSQLTQFTTFITTTKSCEQLSEEQLLELEIRVEKMVTLYATYDQFQGQLEYLSAKPDEQYSEREQFESNYYKQLASARALLSQHRAQLASKVSSNEQLSVVTRHNNVRLPKINLPHFSGGYKDWLEFKDIYISLIHEDKSIDNINKFHYLRSSLNGSAALVIKSLDFRGDNYDNAWQLLCERYDNKQLLINNHIQALFSVEHLQRESSQGLRLIVDVTSKNLRSLATLGLHVKYWGEMVIHLMASKLDPVTSRQWEEHRNTLTEYPSLDMFTKFISNRCNLLETLEEAKNLRSTPESSHSKAKSFSASTSKGKFHIACPLCKQSHYIFTCDEFKALPVADRLSKAMEFKLCLNCLRPGHLAATCPLSHCKYCKKKHNTMLHSHDDEPTSSKEHISLAGTNHDYSSRHVLLSTALVRVTDYSGMPHSARVLLDNGSTANFVTKDLCGKLHLPISSVSSHVAGINSQVSTITQSCALHIQSCDGSYNIDIDCFVLPNITTHIPHSYIDLTDLQLPAGVSLADPSFNVPSSIDILVGADIFWSVIGRNRIQLGRHMPTLFETKLGWLLSGTIPQPNRGNTSVCMFSHDRHTSHVQTPMDLSRFRELDSIPHKFNFTSEERECEQNYINTTRRNADVRFIATIPLKEPPETLGNSFEMAKRRFLLSERRLDRDPSLKQRYVEYLQEYEALGHMSEVSQPSSSHAYNLPHHGVFRESSISTNLRVVFDASAVTTSRKSFNDTKGIRPVVQDDLIIPRLAELTLKPDKCISWCNSMIVLGWLSASPGTLKPFVRNRVSEMREGFGSYTWRTVPSKAPADLVSRGLSADLIGQSSHHNNTCQTLINNSSSYSHLQRLLARTVQPIMGNLPKDRVELELPFLETGTDYAGPILLAERKGRGFRLLKSYIHMFFICLATRAVHLELVSDLTKHDFIAALNRFIARRGKPNTIYSDNGTTFIGTCNEIADILNQDYSSEMADTGINFNFIPAYTPHFGGLWESAVKSVKHHLRRILGFAHLTYEEMSTCLIQVEAILNSRPLTPLSTDPSDLYPLTPAHFLIGRSLTSLPHPQVINQNISSLKRFQRIEHLKQQFWNRFSNEYIFYLQQRTKWTDSDGVLEEGAMVVLKEQQSPPLMWPLGRIIRLIPGRDGISRVADIQTKRGIVRRAYNTICPLPV